MITSSLRSTPMDTDTSQLLVIVPDGLAGGQPRVFLADSELQTEHERIFANGQDVVRLPRRVAVVVRPVRPATDALPAVGEQNLLAAILRSRNRLRAASWAGEHGVPEPRGGSLS